MADNKPLLTGEHVLRRSWSENDEALKIIPAANTEFAIELSADDGDSVLMVANSSTIEDTEEHSCVGMTTVCLYGSGTVSVSPVDNGDDWHVLTVTPLTPIKICARRIKISGGKLVMQSV